MDFDRLKGQKVIHKPKNSIKSNKFNTYGAGEIISFKNRSDERVFMEVYFPEKNKKF